MMKDQQIFNLEDGHVKIRGVYIGLPIESPTNAIRPRIQQ